MRLLPFFAAAALLSASFSAHADTLSFTSSFMGSGTFTATPTNDGSGSYLVTAINDDPNVVLLPVTAFGYGSNDNLVFPGESEPVDGEGLGVLAFQRYYDVFDLPFGAANVGLADESFYGTVYLGSLTVNDPTSVTPEPSSIALLGTGLLGIAGVVRKRSA